MDRAAFNQWLASVAPRSPLEGVVAYNFNIAQSSESFVVELVGSSYYDAADPDWACDETWTSRPSEFQSSYAVSGEAWEPFLREVFGAVKSFLVSGAGAASSLARAEAVTVGFVDGELLVVKGGADA